MDLLGFAMLFLSVIWYIIIPRTNPLLLDSKDEYESLTSSYALAYVQLTSQAYSAHSYTFYNFTTPWSIQTSYPAVGRR